MSVPVGTIIPFYGTVDLLPGNYLLCEGQRIMFGTHPKLWKLLRATDNKDLLLVDPKKPFSPSNTLQFNQVRVPDLRGEFLRGIYVTKDRDPKTHPDVAESLTRRVGSFQDHAFKIHNHDTWGSQGDPVMRGHIGDMSNFVTNKMRSDITNTAGTAEETRPRNIGVVYLIRTGSDPDDHPSLAVVPTPISDGDLANANDELVRQGFSACLKRE